MEAERSQDDLERSPSSASFRSIAFLCSLLGGATGGVLLAAFYPFFTLPPHLAELPPTAASEKLLEQNQVAAAQAYQNAACAFALMGGCLGLGVGWGASQRPAASRLANAAVAGITGAIAGSVAGPAGWWTWNRLGVDDALGMTGGTIASHVVAWGITCAGVGLGSRLIGGGFGSILERKIGLGVAGAAAGLLHVPLFALISTFVDKLAGIVTETYIPLEDPTKAIWGALAGALCGVALCVSKRPSPTNTATEEIGGGR